MLPRCIAPLLLLLLATTALADSVPLLRWQLQHSQLRLPNHFTQGLVFAEGRLYESTGRFGQSRLIRYRADTLEPEQQYFLPADRFAEGLTFLDGTLYQSTWTSRELRRYTPSLQPLPSLPIDGESWGLTTDGHALIMSDGSASLQYLDPRTARVLQRIAVTDSTGLPRKDLNELEWVDGRVLANVWHRNAVLVINPANGMVEGQYDLSALLPELDKFMPKRNSEQVLNGMAWHAAEQSLLLTGKDWPVWFRVKLLDRPTPASAPAPH